MWKIFYPQKKTKPLRLCFRLVGLSGLEPPTPTLSGWCSNLLSYNPIWVVEIHGFEPRTSWMQIRRSTNWAISPRECYKIIAFTHLFVKWFFEKSLHLQIANCVMVLSKIIFYFLYYNFTIYLLKSQIKYAKKNKAVPYFIFSAGVL